MKKITLLFLLILSLPVLAQDSDMKVYLEKTDIATIEQYELIKKVNSFYPDIMISKEVKNKFKNNFKTNEFLSADLIYEDIPKYKIYNVTILDNRCLSYTFVTADDVLTFGEIRTFDGNTVRTLYKLDKGKSLMQYFINGKLINEVKG
ncbi:hypothetical protein [Flavobacterium sp. B183]|uniref:hypothetical protein n=1 Tax=Flavobacterium sp. B183 TaxID=907046 RepID=UPI00201FACDE|nr:hypothetical protein [Flavobacterium sp. B183]URC11438.1 hypothetical protein M4I44_15190 [Flavobacterium sp. B183]